MVKIKSICVDMYDKTNIFVREGEVEEFTPQVVTNFLSEGDTNDPSDLGEWVEDSGVITLSSEEQMWIVVQL